MVSTRRQILGAAMLAPLGLLGMRIRPKPTFVADSWDFLAGDRAISSMEVNDAGPTQRTVFLASLRTDSARMRIRQLILSVQAPQYLLFHAQQNPSQFSDAPIQYSHNLDPSLGDPMLHWYQTASLVIPINQRLFEIQNPPALFTLGDLSADLFVIPPGWGLGISTMVAAGAQDLDATAWCNLLTP